MTKFIAYKRVSTKDQDYGLDAQDKAINSYVKSGGELIKSFSEKQSGKNNQRPQLHEAVKAAKAIGATLLISKLDRLSRDVLFIFQLKAELDGAGVELACVDLPTLNTLTLGIFATMAQHEAELISQRTKDGLAVAKTKGRVGGRKKGCDNTETLAIAREAMQEKIKARDKGARTMALKLRGHKETLEDIAQALNDVGITAPRGGPCNAITVLRLLEAA